MPSIRSLFAFALAASSLSGVNAAPAVTSPSTITLQSNGAAPTTTPYYGYNGTLPTVSITHTKTVITSTTTTLPLSYSSSS